jgi:hypothetical protein
MASLNSFLLGKGDGDKFEKVFAEGWRNPP